jgi:uncharacterized protein (TIRG00374 family)
VIIAVLIVGSIWGVVHNLDIDQFIEIFSNIRWEYALLSVPIAILSNVVRAVRWKIYLKPIKEAKSFLNLFSAVMVGYAINNITPRGGEIVRPFVYARRENISKSAVLATIIVERVIDVIFLLILFFIAFLASKESIMAAFPWLTTDSLTYMSILVLAVVVMLFLVISTNIVERIIKLVAKPLLPKYYDKIAATWDNFKVGFASLKNGKSYIKNILYSALMWFLYAIPSYMMFFCFDFQDTLHLGIFDAGLLLVVSGIGMSIAPTPGGIGVYHWLITTALMSLHPSISNEEALAFATVAHGVNLLQQVLVGMIFIVRENVRGIPKDDVATEEVAIETNDELSNI